jgi:hypothetical protein
LLDKIKDLTKKKPIFDDLPGQLQDFFVDEVKQQRRRDFNESASHIERLSQEELIEPYITDIRRSRPIISRALQKAHIVYSNYIKMRDDLAYLSYYRRRISYSNNTLLECNAIKKKTTKKGYNDIDDSHKPLNEEIDD